MKTDSTLHPPRYSQLSLSQREEISLLKEQGMGQRQIASLLNRSPSTISKGAQTHIFGSFYRAWSAHRLSTQRESKPHSKARLKILRLCCCVESRLKQRWSPQIISGRLRMKRGNSVISHEAIYQWIYAERPDLRLTGLPEEEGKGKNEALAVTKAPKYRGESPFAIEIKRQATERILAI